MNVTEHVMVQAGDTQAGRATNALLNAKGGEHDRLMAASRDFEALFIKQMLKAMRSTVNKSGFIDGGFAEEIYEDMLYDEYAKKMSTTGNLGIAKMLYDQMSAYL